MWYETATLNSAALFSDIIKSTLIIIYLVVIKCGIRPYCLFKTIIIIKTIIVTIYLVIMENETILK